MSFFSKMPATGLAAALACAASVSISAPAHAELDNKCIDKWMLSMQLQAVGKSCKLADKKTAAAIAGYEKKHYACIVANADPKEKSQFTNKTSRDMRKAAMDGLKNMKCDDKTERMFKGMLVLVSH